MANLKIERLDICIYPNYWRAMYPLQPTPDQETAIYQARWQRNWDIAQNPRWGLIYVSYINNKSLTELFAKLQEPTDLVVCYETLVIQALGRQLSDRMIVTGSEGFQPGQVWNEIQARKWHYNPKRLCVTTYGDIYGKGFFTLDNQIKTELGLPNQDTKIPELCLAKEDITQPEILHL